MTPLLAVQAGAQSVSQPPTPGTKPLSVMFQVCVLATRRVERQKTYWFSYYVRPCRQIDAAAGIGAGSIWENI
jgi:hypothetical protein